MQNINEAIDKSFGIRFYSGKQKLMMLSKRSPMKTALYYVLEEGKLEKDTFQILLCRQCWRKQK